MLNPLSPQRWLLSIHEWATVSNCTVKLWYIERRSVYSKQDSGAYLRRSHQALACIRLGSSTCSFRRCSCSGAHTAVASIRTRSDLNTENSQRGYIVYIDYLASSGTKLIHNRKNNKNTISPLIKKILKIAKAKKKLSYRPWLHVLPVYPGKHLHLLGPTHSPCLHPNSHWAKKRVI